MTYNEAYQKANLLGMMPLGNAEFKFPASLSTAIILLQVEYQRKLKEFDETMAEVLKKLKKEGFDDRSQAIQKMEDIDKRLKEHEKDNSKPKPSDKEIAEADEIRKTEEEYRKEFDELDKQFTEAKNKKAEEKIGGFNPVLTKEEYGMLVETIGVSGDIVLPNIQQPIPKVTFLHMVAEILL